MVLHHVYRGTWRLRLGVPLALGLFGLFALGCYRGAMARYPYEGMASCQLAGRPP